MPLAQPKIRLTSPRLAANETITINGIRYRVLEKGIHGEMGSSRTNVCRATRVNPDGTLKGEFIIKRPSDYAAQNTAIRLRKAHPEISPLSLSMFECNELEIGELIVTNLIPGTPLDKFRETLHKDATEATINKISWRVAIQIILALQPLQKAGLIHRDIKAANLIVQEKTIGITDIDWLTDKEAVKQEEDDGIFGTPAFITPQMTRSRYDIDHTTDPYQTACTTYGMMKGRLYKPSIYDTMVDRANGKFEREVQCDLANKEDNCPEDARLPFYRLRKWIREALRHDSCDRPQTIEEHLQLLTDTPNIQMI